MAIITTNTSRLSVVDKCERGSTIISLSTDNPNLPGNEAALAAFSAVQGELVAANADVVAAQGTLRAMLTRRETVEKKWDRQIAQLAGVTEAIGNSDPEAITSGGFGVRGAAPKPKPLAAPKALRALTNGRPGMTKLTWEVLDGAAIFLVEMSLDAGSPVNWQRMTTSTKTSCEIDGAEPGKPAWFRVAAVNPAGQGPWSAEALRQVM